jgi:hypothetical protein
LPAVARAAQQKRPPTCVPNALNQAKVVHRRTPPPEIRPPTATRATLHLSNASTAATEGSKVMTSGPSLWWPPNRPAPRRAGPTTPLSGRAQISALFGARPHAHLKAVVDALQALRGVAKITAITLATEFGTFRRFEHASAVMSYTGLVPSEHSSGARSRRGKITKTGNSHLRRVLIESAWHYRHRPHLCLRQRRLQQALSPSVAAMAWRAQERLHRRYWLLSNKSKPAAKVVTALARELVGFIWAIGTEVEASLSSTPH